MLILILPTWTIGQLTVLQMNACLPVRSPLPRPRINHRHRHFPFLTTATLSHLRRVSVCVWMMINRFLGWGSGGLRRTYCDCSNTVNCYLTHIERPQLWQAARRARTDSYHTWACVRVAACTAHGVVRTSSNEHLTCNLNKLFENIIFAPVRRHQPSACKAICGWLMVPACRMLASNWAKCRLVLTRSMSGARLSRD